MKIWTWLRNIALAGVAAALAAAALPASAVYASGAGDPPPPLHGELTVEQLQNIWQRQQRHYERLGRMLEHADEMIARAEERLSLAAENGEDTAELQAALDAFADAIEDARALYPGASAIVEAHAGFDADGSVTNDEQAHETVRAMHEKLEEIREVLAGPGRALRHALGVFRAANNHAGPRRH